MLTEAQKAEILKNNTDRIINGVRYCKHNQELDTCGYCSIDAQEREYSKESIQREKIEASEAEKQWKQKYEDIKARCKNYFEIWTEDEIHYIYQELKDARKKYLRKLSYKLAVELERTTGAIKAKYIELFSHKTDIHRGNAMINFRSKNQLI